MGFELAFQSNAGFLPWTKGRLAGVLQHVFSLRVNQLGVLIRVSESFVLWQEIRASEASMITIFINIRLTWSKFLSHRSVR